MTETCGPLRTLHYRALAVTKALAITVVAATKIFAGRTNTAAPHPRGQRPAARPQMGAGPRWAGGDEPRPREGGAECGGMEESAHVIPLAPPPARSAMLFLPFLAPSGDCGRWCSPGPAPAAAHSRGQVPAGAAASRSPSPRPLPFLQQASGGPWLRGRCPGEGGPHRALSPPSAAG